VVTPPARLVGASQDSPRYFLSAAAEHSMGKRGLIKNADDLEGASPVLHEVRLVAFVPVQPDAPAARASGGFA